MTGSNAACVFCASTGGELLWHDESCRVILADEPGFAGLCRVIWQAHVAEMTDLTVAERGRLMRVVFAAEQALRQTLQPDKINLASLGNVTPHLHWHVISRYRNDRNFPDPVWNPPRRVNEVPLPVDFERLKLALRGILDTATTMSLE